MLQCGDGVLIASSGEVSEPEIPGYPPCIEWVEALAEVDLLDARFSITGRRQEHSVIASCHEVVRIALDPLENLRPRLVIFAPEQLDDAEHGVREAVGFI